MTVLGIDVSAHQASTPDTTGLGFLIARATYGEFHDAMYREHVADARSHGLIVGAYHFGRRTPSALAQAREFLQAAGDVDLYALDLESDGGNPAMSLDQARTFIRAVKATGRQIGLYHSESGYPSLGQDWRWVANWSRLPSIAWQIWQYRGSPLDHDRWAGSQTELERFVHGSTSGGPIIAEDESVDIDLSDNLTYRRAVVLEAGAPITDGQTTVAHATDGEILPLIGTKTDSGAKAVLHAGKERFVPADQVRATISGSWGAPDPSGDPAAAVEAERDRIRDVLGL